MIVILTIKIELGESILSTKLTWVVPSFYCTCNKDVLVFDFLLPAKKIMENKNNITIAKNLEPKNILKAKIILPPFGECVYDLSLKNDNKFIYEIIEKYCNNKFNTFEDIIKRANLDCSRSISIITLEFNFDINIPKELIYADEDFISRYGQCLSLVKEIGNIFHSATHLIFHCDYPTVPSLNKINSGGLFYFSNNNKFIYSNEFESAFTYPVVFIKKGLKEFNNLIEVLSSIWHFSLWPLRRFAKAFNSENVDMENFLDLIFSLEGLFDKNISSDFIKHSCIVLISKNHKEAKKIRNLLDQTYKIRNNIVHGSQIYKGLEKIKLDGKKTLSQKIFFELKPIVARMILFAINKICKNSNLRNLTINSDDVIDKIFT